MMPLTHELLYRWPPELGLPHTWLLSWPLRGRLQCYKEMKRQQSQYDM
jgi:hypothetical protein